MELQEHIKLAIENKEFHGEVRNTDLSVRRLSHVFAVDVAFFDVNFKQCDFANSYFRNCRFIRCNFTGATIKDSNFRGSQFEECNFRYTSWEKSILDEHFLDSCLPSEENLARDLVRSLRVNFSQIGNYDAVNKAASIEVSLTGQHLYNAAYSRQSYYRSKYKGWARISNAISHARWKTLDLLWGNGESILRVALSGLVVVIVAALALLHNHSQLIFSDALWSAFYGFWGIQSGVKLPDPYAVTLTIIRFILFGLFMAILVKKLSRR
ncbi:pentapeptide repeat protein [Nitrosomonas oligotropha]|uniref:Pentapeptide repeat protein n=1 Tax=Nitrosomonas oligotropha TaxID=42354 RepID=A0A2T5GZ77_9PROT|nr:pentapeptide repeat-containing protein [Nitrosomonas oligotropha]PTQ64635.1 pentapeptide repeat protein [Nitrosomonas oligotropha]